MSFIYIHTHIHSHNSLILFPYYGHFTNIKSHRLPNKMFSARCGIPTGYVHCFAATRTWWEDPTTTEIIHVGQRIVLTEKFSSWWLTVIILVLRLLGKKVHQQINLTINSVNSANDQVVKISNNDMNVMKITNHILGRFKVYCRERKACLYSKSCYQLVRSWAPEVSLFLVGFGFFVNF